jgi:hypothetical protein
MRGCIAALLLFAASALGQMKVDRSRVPTEWQDFRPRSTEPELECKVTPIKPLLNYSFRFQTGYLVRMPIRNYQGKAQRLLTFFRVTPRDKEREPSYFLSFAQLPKGPGSNVTIEFGGGYVVGEGEYRVDWVLADESGRVCTKNWSIRAKLGRKERGIRPGMAAGAVEDISLRRWTRASGGARDEQGHRVTVLLNASPLSLRQLRLGGYDRALLLSSLASMLERLPLRSVRLVAFNLDQQREIYRREDFASTDFGRLSRTLGELELALVDYEVLKNRRGHVKLVLDLIAESLEKDRPDAVVFLGPQPRSFDKINKSLLPERSPGDPPLYYVQLRPYSAAANFPDTVMNAVDRMNGKTFQVYSPGDFAEAIKEISKTLEERKRVPAEAVQ